MGRELIALEEHPVIAEFKAYLRRPEGRAGGVNARLFAANGPDADVVLSLGRSHLQDSLVHVCLVQDGEEIGGFYGYVRRPKPLVCGMVACIFGEDGEEADMITATGLSRYLETPVQVCIRLVKEPSGAPAGKREKGPYGKEARDLWRSGFFSMRRVQELVGTDMEFIEWLRTRKCAVDYEECGPCGGDVVAAHCRRISAGAGKGIKPEYSALPVCNTHHQIQHQKGEEAIGGREWMELTARRCAQEWAWNKWVADKGYSSMTFVAPAEVFRWASRYGLDQYLPLVYALQEFDRVGS